MHSSMSIRKLMLLFLIMAGMISVPFVWIHLAAAPDDAPITPVQHAVAALANYCGPWGVAMVRLVDFPNAGLRSFSWPLALGMTLIGGLLVALALKTRQRWGQILLTALWGLFLVLWFGTGLFQIADGLL